MSVEFPGPQILPLGKTALQGHELAGQRHPGVPSLQLGSNSLELKAVTGNCSTTPEHGVGCEDRPAGTTDRKKGRSTSVLARREIPLL